MIALLLLLLAAPVQSQEDELIRLLDNLDPSVRANTCETLGILRSSGSIYALIKRVDDKVLRVRSAAADALTAITGKDFGTDFVKWKYWWKTKGEETFRRAVTKPEEVQRAIQPMLDKVNDTVREAKSEIRILSITVAVIGFVFVLVMIFFVGNVSSKLKEWKATAKQTEVYLREGEEITKRTDKIIDELESKKLDIVEFIGKLKDENQGELERYSDLLQSNMEHRMREEVLSLRQKAEKELESTLGERKASIDHEIRTIVSQHREKLEKAVEDMELTFSRNVDAHTQYLEACFYKANGKTDEALRLYKKLLSLKPNHAVAWNDMGSVLRELMRFDEAIDAYESALEHSPEDSIVLYNMAATYGHQHRRREMLDTLARAIRNDGEFKDEALNDPAFRDYWDDPAFKDIAES